jgi:hypothetical protein
MATLDIDVMLTRALLVRNAPGTVNDLNEYVDAPFSIDEDPTKTATFIYPIEYEGIPVIDPDTGLTNPAIYPDTPAGFTLTTLTPVIKAHLTDAAVSIGEDTSGWGYSPPPSNYPFLLVQGIDIAFDTFPVGSDPTDLIVAGASTTLDNEAFQSPVYMLYGFSPTTVPHVIVSEYGWRFTYEGEAPATSGIPPRRIFQRTDGATHGAPRLFGNR